MLLPLQLFPLLHFKKNCKEHHCKQCGFVRSTQRHLETRDDGDTFICYFFDPTVKGFKKQTLLQGLSLATGQASGLQAEDGQEDVVSRGVRGRSALFDATSPPLLHHHPASRKEMVRKIFSLTMSLYPHPQGYGQELWSAEAARVVGGLNLFLRQEKMRKKPGVSFPHHLHNHKIPTSTNQKS